MTYLTGAHLLLVNGTVSSLCGLGTLTGAYSLETANGATIKVA